MKNYFSALVACIFVVLSANSQQVNILGDSLLRSPVSCYSYTDISVYGQLSQNYTHPGDSLRWSNDTLFIDMFYTFSGVGIPTIISFNNVLGLGNGLNAGTYKVYIRSFLNGVGSDSAYSSFDINAADVSFQFNENSLCPGDSLYLTNTSSNLTSQRWYLNDSLISSAKNYSTQLFAPGNYHFKLWGDDGKCPDSIEKSIVVFDYPAVDLGNDTTICEGDSIEIGYYDPYAKSYKWSDGVATYKRRVNESGWYVLEVTGRGDCKGTDSIFVEVQDCISGLNKLFDSDLTIKSTEDLITIVFDQAIWVDEIQLYNIQGGLESVQYLRREMSAIDIQTGHLQRGVYVLILKMKNASIPVKFIR